MIINKELGLNFNENPWQGSFAVEYLTDLVEEAVYKEFEAISERGGVLGAMDTMYQRGKIQEESMYYEHKKHDGSLPLVGVNTFLPKEHAEGGQRDAGQHQHRQQRQQAGGRHLGAAERGDSDEGIDLDDRDDGAGEHARQQQEAARQRRRQQHPHRPHLTVIDPGERVLHAVPELDQSDPDRKSSV